jgi:hypothetical protein
LLLKYKILEVYIALLDLSFQLLADHFHPSLCSLQPFRLSCIQFSKLIVTFRLIYYPLPFLTLSPPSFN